ncbi:MAG: hypothetical protein KAS07_01900, partial [Candidatus Pacebacteria bacterium]|nr:hypothetical protein [Candidatus Paceibacterota bacterium]
YEKFAMITLKKPFKKNLRRKNKAMKYAVAKFNKLVKFQVGDVTAAATYYLAEIYYNFSRSLAESERPGNLNDLEMEEYELALDDQVFPFEEKAIAVHRKNLELISIGVYSLWIDKSLERLGNLMPARYAKYEQSTGFIKFMDYYNYDFVAKPVEVISVAPVTAPLSVPVLPDGAKNPDAANDANNTQATESEPKIKEALK